ncbi:GNAT family N-acetyltransferase [Candidatus Bipolaricaulota bacterium]|nr:GNAT family N-acetyltransferase [Candidatus Bipolaricaulota bacterium]
MEIVALSWEHENALAEFVREFSASGETHIPAYLPDPDWSFQETVEGFAKQSRGEDLPEGWVPGTTRFLIHEERILGVSNLRHRLTEGLLQFGGHVGYSVRPSDRGKGHGTRLLEGAMELGREMSIDRLLVTCDPQNVASAKVIVKCGGVLENQFFHAPAGREVARYWIALTQRPLAADR